MSVRDLTYPQFCHFYSETPKQSKKTCFEIVTPTGTKYYTKKNVSKVFTILRGVNNPRAHKFFLRVLLQHVAIAPGTSDRRWTDILADTWKSKGLPDPKALCEQLQLINTTIPHVHWAQDLAVSGVTPGQLRWSLVLASSVEVSFRKLLEDLNREAPEVLRFAVMNI